MRINNSNSYTPQNKNNKQNNNNNVSFSGNSKFRQGFEKIADKCNIGPNGSLARNVFLAVSSVFMVGARFFKSRGEDERREVLTRDIPGIVLAVYGAPVLNSGVAYLVTKKTGVPIIQFVKNKESNTNKASFVSQKQVKDWYSNLTELKNPLITFSETIEKHGGNIKKAMSHLGLDSHLKNITGKDEASNKEIIASLKKLQAEKSDKFIALEKGLLKETASENKLLKIAKNTQAAVKVSGLLFTAGLLGIILPRLNIKITKNKYQHKPTVQESQNESKQPQATAQTINKSI